MRQLKVPDARHHAAAEHQIGDGPDERVETIRAAAARHAIGTKAAHLIFKLVEGAHVRDAAFGVESGNRLGAQPLS